MEYCCHVWTGALSCYFELLHKLQKRICKTFGPSLAASLEPLAQNVASLSLFCRYYFGRCSSELAQLVPLPISWGRSIRYSDRLHDFSITIPRCYKNVYANRFFPGTARLWNCLPIECFPLTYDLSAFKSRINRDLLTGFFQKRFPLCFNHFVLLFPVTPCPLVAAQLYMEWILQKKQTVRAFFFWGKFLPKFRGKRSKMTPK